MTASEWVLTAKPEAPERLVARVRAVLDAAPRPAASVADALVDAAESLLDDVLKDAGGPARDKALDLLAADACVTWAFEAAADEPAALAARADAAMARLAQAVA